MSIASVTAEQVQTAVMAVLDELVDIIVPLFGNAPSARLLGLPGDPMDATTRFVETPPEERDPNRYTDGVAYYAASMWAYAWRGDSAGGQHPTDSWPEIQLLGDVAAALAGRVEFDLSFRNGSVFGDRRVGEDRAVDIVKWVVDAYKARGRIDFLGGGISIEELAALARVSEKTLRMAANPKNPGALRTIKRGHRTYITTSDAMEWLSRRPDFVPTRDPTDYVAGDLDMGGGAVQLRSYLLDLESRQPDIRGAASAVGMSDAQVDALFAGSAEPALPADLLLRFAENAQLAQPSCFARWVLDLQHRTQVEQAEAYYRRQVSRLSPQPEGED